MCGQHVSMSLVLHPSHSPSSLNYQVAVEVEVSVLVSVTQHYADYQRTYGQWDQLSKILMSLSIDIIIWHKIRIHMHEQRTTEMRSMY